MKSRRITLLATIVLLGFSLAAFGKSFTGDIMDSGCATMGSHAQMEPMHHLPPSSALTGKEARECTLMCVKAGGHFVLCNPASKKTYQLDPANDARPYAGEHVSITGTLNGDTIHVQKIARSRF